MTIPEPTLAREIAAALDWWRACGVDSDFADDARAWLANPAETAPPAGADSAASPDASRDAAKNHPVAALPDETARNARRDFWGDSPPTSLAAFQEWWMSDPALAARGLSPRVAPRGGEGAKLMVIVPDPEPVDSAVLLSGPQGRLLTRIFAAMGLAEGECYIASALPAHTPMADLPALAASGLDAVVSHHVKLVAPQKVVLFGHGLTPFLGSAAQNEGHALREINHGALRIPVMATETLGAMLDMPQLKARFWRRWMEWSA